MGEHIGKLNILTLIWRVILSYKNLSDKYTYFSISFFFWTSAIFRARASSNLLLVVAKSSLCCSILSPSHLVTGNSGKSFRGFSTISASEAEYAVVLEVLAIISRSFNNCSLIFSTFFLSSLLTNSLLGAFRVVFGLVGVQETDGDFEFTWSFFLKAKLFEVELDEDSSKDSDVL